MIYPVKYLHSAMRGAPVLSGTAGTLLAVLDACLGTGFGLSTLQTLTISNGIATATVNAGESFEEGAVILIDGATPGALNGEARVLTADSVSFTFATDAADGAAMGTITAKYAPVHGWQKIFTDTNVAVWKSTDLEANGHCLRVDDSIATYALLRGYESMTDASTGIGPFPTTTQEANGCRWNKSASTNGNKVTWRLFGDSRIFYVAIVPGTAQGQTNTYLTSNIRGFGDVTAFNQLDAWSTLLSGNSSSSTGPQEGGAFTGGVQSLASTAYSVAPRIAGGTGAAVFLNLMPYTTATAGTTTISGNNSWAGAFPPSLDGALRLSRVAVFESGGAQLRAEVPGVYHVPQSGLTSRFNGGDTILGMGELAGRRLIAVAIANSGTYTNITPVGVGFVDATGPWR